MVTYPYVQNIAHHIASLFPADPGVPHICPPLAGVGFAAVIPTGVAQRRSGGTCMPFAQPLPFASAAHPVLADVGLFLLYILPLDQPTHELLRYPPSALGHSRIPVERSQLDRPHIHDLVRSIISRT